MKIYDRPGFPNPARIRIVLAEKGLDAQIEFVSVDLIGAEHKQAAFLAKNPSGVLPVLELDDGTLISESTAITEYLDNLDGKPTLTGRTPREKAMIHMMQRRAEAEVLDAVGNYFHNATPGLGPILQVYKNPEWSDRTAWGQLQRDKALAGLAYFDGVLARSPFVAGETFSMADITLFAGLMFADAAGIAIPAEHTNLAAWRARVADLPSVKNRSGQQFGAEDLRRLGF
ncbi:MAG: glutathione S-transferase family protein [Janthinobacterium lividum]